MSTPNKPLHGWVGADDLGPGQEIMNHGHEVLIFIQHQGAGTASVYHPGRDKRESQVLGEHIWATGRLYDVERLPPVHIDPLPPVQGWVSRRDLTFGDEFMITSPEENPDAPRRVYLGHRAYSEGLVYRLDLEMQMLEHLPDKIWATGHSWRLTRL